MSKDVNFAILRHELKFAAGPDPWALEEVKASPDLSGGAFALSDHPR
jgi:hypothetical protein